MGQILAHYDPPLATVKPTRGAANPKSGKSVTRRRKRLLALVRVPDLDWPSNLFSDNVTELPAESFRWDLASGQEDPENYFRAAA